MIFEKIRTSIIIIINLYLPSVVFIAQVLVGPSKQLKQIFQIEHNIVKNPNWPEANDNCAGNCARLYPHDST